jgi:hypothetical protein
VAEPGLFQAFYDSPLQHPWLLWLAAAAAMAVVLTRTRLPQSTRRYCIGLGLLSLADGWLTSNSVLGIGALSGAASSVVPLFFVLVGDLRFLVVATSGGPGGTLRPTGRTLGVALVLTLIVPVSSQVIVGLLPDALSGNRTLFLVYELSFALLVIALLRWHTNVRGTAWVRSVARFVLLYYLLWATADILILLLGDLGYLLRVLPNLLYYGGLIAVIAAASARAAGVAESERG